MMNDEQLFKEAYKAMPAYEKSLYRDYKIKLPEGVSVQEAITKLITNPDIAYAEENRLNELFFTPNDPYYFSSNSWNQNYDDLWGIKKVQCEGAWDIAEGKGITVAVVDTGVDYNHSDIAANIWVNTLEIPDNGIDDDGNGYIDDIRGWDFSGDDASMIEDKNPMDTMGHGTHVAGTIAAVGNNNIGVIGVAPKSKIMPVKVFPNAYDDICAKGIKYAVDNGARITSNSWGGWGDSTTLYNIFEYAHNRGAVSVAAAGNDSANLRLSSLIAYTRMAQHMNDATELAWATNAATRAMQARLRYVNNFRPVDGNGTDPQTSTWMTGQDQTPSVFVQRFGAMNTNIPPKGSITNHPIIGIIAPATSIIIETISNISACLTW